MRRCGHTYRQALTALMRMSEEEGITIGWMFSTRPAADQAMDTVMAMVSPIGNFVEINRANRRVVFKNGSRLEFHVVDRDRMRGTRFDAVLQDNSLGDLALWVTAPETSPKSSRPKSKSPLRKLT